MYKKYLYERFKFTEEYKNEVVEFLRHTTNVEIGGHQLWDGYRTHLMQSPWELSDFIFALKKHEKDTGKKLKRFLEVGFASGANNTILHKFFNFENIVGIDLFTSSLDGFNLNANMIRKNLVLISGDSTANRTLKLTESLGPFDLIFIDANHTYDYVKQDFENYVKYLDKGGVIAFHDIDCPDWPGINKFWNELKMTEKYNMTEFVCRDYRLQFGIGMITMR